MTDAAKLELEAVAGFGSGPDPTARVGCLTNRFEAIAGRVFGEPRRESMIGNKSASFGRRPHPRVAQPYR